MLRSMTGFGAASAKSEHGGVSVELRCLNHRFKEVKARLPREIAFLEPKAVKIVSERVERGAVEVTVRNLEGARASRGVRLDEGLAEEIVEAMRKLKARHGLAGEVTIEALTSVEGVLEISERPTSVGGFEELLDRALRQALEEAMAMREEEGRALAEDLRGRVSTVRSIVDVVEKEAEKMPAVHKARIDSRIKSLLADAPLDSGRLEAEVAILVDRSDVSEEITRLRSHLGQLEELVDNAEESVGRRLGFLLQELGREINTVGSKSQSSAISHHVVDLKAELERMREQVQNIE